MTPTRRAYAIWIVGLVAYIVAVLQRTSLGVAGLDASARFDASASVLATFAVVQLLVYAMLQVPVGVLLDRFGSRRLLVIGAILMASGQLLIAVTDELPTAVAARVLVGAGDAMTFVSVLRVISAWFPARQVPVLTQFTGIIGQLGQLLSAIPLVALLHGPGWTPAFASIAALGVIAGVLAAAALRNEPAGGSSHRRSQSLGEISAALGDAWRHPGTRLGMWSHFVTQFSGTAFAMLWGFPFLVSGQGLSPAAASVLMTVFVLCGAAVAPVLGILVARHPMRRSWLVLSIVAVTAGAWTIVLALPMHAPMWLLVGLVLTLTLGGPGSMIGFDFARTFNPPDRLGTATGIVNMGGFVASLVTIMTVGLILDGLSGGSSDYSLGAFRVALSVQFVLWGIGVVGVLRSRKRVRASEGVVVAPMHHVLRRELHNRYQRARALR